MAKSVIAGLMVAALLPVRGWAQVSPLKPDVQDEPPAPRQLHCPAMVGPARFKERPASPNDPDLMRSNSETQAGIARGDPWIMLEATEVCDYTGGGGAWTLTIVASKNPDLGKTNFRKWRTKVKPDSLGGLSGLTPDPAPADGHMHELYTVRQNADGGILILVDYPAAQGPTVGQALAAAAATQPAS